MLSQLNGSKWRRTHQASVDAVLTGTGISRPVFSYGSAFKNMDTWTARKLFAGLKHFSGDVRSLVSEANSMTIPNPHIVIAATPDDLPMGMALALVGGAYHEAWHTLYSRRTSLKLNEVEGPLMERWNKAPAAFWKGAIPALLTWSNIVEDIRIERCGCKRFPGAQPKMVELQDLILKMESEGFAKSMPSNPLLTFVGLAFRDLGLGYDSPRTRNAYAFYEKQCPEAFAIVNGPLKPILDAAINLGEHDDLAATWAAMDIVLALSEEMEKSQESKGQESKGQGSKGQGSKGQGSKGQGSEGQESEGQESDGQESDGQESDGQESEGQGTKGQGTKGQGTKGQESEGEVGAEGGGHQYLNDYDIQQLAAALVEAIADGAEMAVQDGAQALAQAIDNFLHEDLEPDEVAWRPAVPNADEVLFGRNLDPKTGFNIRNSVRKEIAALRSRLRNRFLAARTPVFTHGVRQGCDISERRMVDSIVEIKSGIEPTRPDYRRDQKPDCSLAVALVIDESGSMSDLRMDTIRAAVAIADALASLGCPILVVGPRNGSYSKISEHAPEITHMVDCHRQAPVVIDVFKDWDEPMNKALPRFPGIVATGGTPLEDGIQYALQMLNKRHERHRIVLTLTDGLPDNPGVVRGQIRIAAESKINIVGVALDQYAAQGVKHLFPENVIVQDMAALPTTLASYLEGVIFPSKARKMKLENGFKNTHA